MTGPLTCLGISVSVALSVCSYVWLAVFVIHYSNLSITTHKILFFLIPLPLLLAHEMMSYMAWPLIILCALKDKNEVNFFNKLSIKSMIIFLIIVSLTACYFIFTINEIRSNNNLSSFKTALIHFKFLFQGNAINLSVLTAFLLQVSLFMQCVSGKIKNRAQWLVLFLLSSAFVLTAFAPFSVYNKFFFVGDYPARVWPPVLSLPFSLLLWWLYEMKILSFKKAKLFLFSCLIFCLTAVAYRVKSDFQFYKHQKQFSEQLGKCQGLLEWPLVKNIFYDIEDYFKLEKQIWKISTVSMIYPQSKDIQAVILNTNCIDDCLKNGNSLDICRGHCGHLKFNLPSSLFKNELNTRFFDFEPLIENISKNLSVCRE